ncbi:hypothetical protein NBRC111894_4455 [Sporolactobacillus inulinus]|uniref:Uncharacterized protein n=1 Tax=Sporolactobacillus inulinus TaxID=2078 RepID=A0A4Y1ZIU1_9BACL|nr:hypothetical protein NBRC111894_4455 [Sporolactobacillus inulinus]
MSLIENVLLVAEHRFKSLELFQLEVYHSMKVTASFSITFCTISVGFMREASI